MKNVTPEEQEVIINLSRIDDVATIYCSDVTWITKMDKLVKKSPDLFKVIMSNDYGKEYSFPKKLITLRSSERKMSEEQKEKASDRFKKMWEEKNRDGD